MRPVQMAFAGFGLALGVESLLLISNVVVSYLADGQTVTGWAQKNFSGVTGGK